MRAMLIFYSAFLVFAGTLFVLPPSASAQSSCDQYLSGAVPPAGFGASWNTLTSSRELLLRTTCSGSTAQITAGTGALNQYVYKIGYRWTGTAWQQVNLAGGELIADAWYVGEAFATLAAPSGTTFWVGYVCLWTGVQWKCGCQNTSCTQSYWQLQAFDPSLASSGGSNTGDNTGDNTGGNTDSVDIVDIKFDFSTHRRLAPGSDNWPVTWSNDGHLYTSWGDGGGFGGSNNDGRVSLGFGRIEGGPDNYTAHNVWGGKNAPVSAKHGGKSYAMLSINGTLYAWVANIGNPSNQWGGDMTNWTLMKSTDKAKSWKSTGFVMRQAEHGGAFWNAAFLNFGKDYAGARDNYVYTYWVGEKEHKTWSGSSDYAYLTRVPKDQIENKNAYEYFAGLNNGNPTWVKNSSGRKPVFQKDGGVHWAFNVRYIAPLGKYLLMTNLVENVPQSLNGRTDLAFYQADEPWGPWEHVKTFSDWRPPDSTSAQRYTFFWDIPSKWVSSDGKTFTFVYTGKGVHDSWNTIRGTFVTE